MKKARRIAMIGVLVVVAIAFAVGIFSCRTPSLGLKEGALLPCPTSPNCVCSQDPDAEHSIDPIHFEGSADEAWAQAKSIVRGWPRTKILDDSADYCRAVTQSLIFRFRDDLELLLDRNASCIHVRAAARVGYSDLGANRKRVERLRTAMKHAHQ